MTFADGWPVRSQHLLAHKRSQTVTEATFLYACELGFNCGSHFSSATFCDPTQHILRTWCRRTLGIKTRDCAQSPHLAGQTTGGKRQLWRWCLGWFSAQIWECPTATKVASHDDFYQSLPHCVTPKTYSLLADFNSCSQLRCASVA